MRSPEYLTAFIDWDSARRLCRAELTQRQRPYTSNKRALDELQRSLASALMEHEPRTVLRVHLRIYHGWYAGKTKTKDLLEMAELTAEGPRTIDRVSFAPNLELSQSLLCGGPRGQLYDTCRGTNSDRRQQQKQQQKMVDTALVSDLLHFARSSLPQSNRQRAIVVGDDDDLLPGVFTALRWGANVKVARIRTLHNVHLNTDDLIYQLRP